MAEYNLTPVFRMEMFIDAIINGTTPPEPQFREEFYLAKMAGMDVDVPEPFTRREFYLAYMIGMDVDLPTPVTRDEMYLAEACGMDVTAPDPVFRDEFWLDELSGGGDEKYQEFTGKIITFFASRAAAIKKMEVTLEPIQDLHGQDAPYPAGGGKNKLQVTATSTTIGGITFTINSDGTVLVDGTSTAPGTRWLDLCFFDNTISFPEETLLSSGVSVNGLKLAWFKGTAGAGDYVATADGVSVPANTVLKSVTIGITGGATINNALVKPMIRSASIADSTFAPYSNICPITGWTGCEVWNDPKYGGLINWNQLVKNGNFEDTSDWNAYGGTIAVSSNTCTFTITGTVTNLGIRIDTSANIDRIVGHKYLSFIDVKVPKNTTGARLYPAGGSYAAGISVSANTWTTLSAMVTETTNSSTGKTQFYLGSSANDGYVAGDTFEMRNVNTFDLTKMFGAGNEPSTVDEFKALFPKDYYPYNAGTETIVSAVNGDPYQHVEVTFPETVYGGSHEFVSGGLKSKMASVDLGTLDWALFSNTSNRQAWIATLIPYFKAAKDANTPINAFCDRAKAVSYNATWLPNTISTNTASSVSGLVFCVEPNKYPDAASFKSAMSGVQLVYELAEPITIQLTPQQISSLRGMNNIWSNSNGDIAVIAFGREVA